MDQNPGWQEAFQKEIQRAEAARSNGNEGQARVCARRAAGQVAAEYLRRRSIPLPDYNAYEALRSLQAFNPLNERARQVVDHFLLRVAPDHNLPVPIDLIAEARWLAIELLGET